jgi:predicted dehydrogenase
MLNIGVVGYGYWGPNLVRNFQKIKGCSIKTICDSRTERIALIKQEYPEFDTVVDYDALIADNSIDAIVIATPVDAHYSLAMKALKNGKHVLLEKPMTSSYSQAMELIDISEKNKTILMVDHTYLYTGSIQKIKQLIDENIIGKIEYFDSTRINLGLFQHDINVLWDLAAHDISIINYLINEKPQSLQAIGVSHTNSKIENIAYLTLKYTSGIIAHFNCSWVSPVKIRHLLIGGNKKMILFNDLDPSEKVKVFDSGYDIKTDEDKRKLLVSYRSGDVYSPKIDNREALYMMASDFINAIESKKSPISNYQIGLDVVKILEASDKSIKNNGMEILL